MSDCVYVVQSGNAANEYEEKMNIFSTKQKALDYCYSLMHNDQTKKGVIVTDCVKEGWCLCTYEDKLIVWKTERTASYVSLVTELLL
jgi:hypothetical protein